MKFKNYLNSLTGDNRIFSNKEIANMSVKEAFGRQDEILAQHSQIGIPSEKELQSSGNVVYVQAYTRNDGTEVKAHWRSKPDGVENNNLSHCTPTGRASEIIGRGIEKYLDLPKGALNIINDEIHDNIMAINRYNESKNIADLPQNNDKFFEKERSKNASWLMRFNGDKNANRPDAKLFMDIALVQPKRVPSTQDYQFISSKKNKEINEKYNLTGNKEIPKHYDGFEFSATSPTALALNNSEEFKNQIFDERKNFNKETGTFKSDKLEIEFEEDKNLKYSFGHMTLLNPKITKDGYVEGLAFDLYNYKLMLGEYVKKDKQGTLYNNGAKVLQSVGHLKNYYIFVPVRLKI